MLPNIFDFLARRGEEDSAALPEAEAPSAVPEIADDESQARMAAIRETIDLIETDLAAMIRDVQRASDAVRGGTCTTADVLGVIREQSKSLATRPAMRPKTDASCKRHGAIRAIGRRDWVAGAQGWHADG